MGGLRFNTSENVRHRTYRDDEEDDGNDAPDRPDVKRMGFSSSSSSDGGLPATPITSGPPEGLVADDDGVGLI